MYFNEQRSQRETCFPCPVGLRKPFILVLKPGPKVPIGDGSPVVTPVGSQITEIAFVTIFLTCPTEGLPPPKIIWKKDGEELASGDRYVIDSEGTLTIPQAILKDTGNYTCSAQNEAGIEEVTSTIDILGMFGAAGSGISTKLW